MPSKVGERRRDVQKEETGEKEKEKGAVVMTSGMWGVWVGDVTQLEFVAQATQQVQ